MYYVDGTLGAAGHAWGILEASSPDGRLLGMDVDPQALQVARANLAPFGSRAIIIRASYATLREQMDLLGWNKVDGILLDLGLSSMQLDTPERGFSFRSDAPLDMRFDPNNPVRAADLVNSLPERDLADLLYGYGEERRSRQIARAIVKARPIHSTQELASLVSSVKKGGRRNIHPATQTFQALRIAVNQELDALESFLPQAVASLKPGGRLAVIAYHSLEDRIVKRFFRRESRDCICPPHQPVCTCGHVAAIKEIERRPIQPQEEEIQRNPRARSARLRVAEKLD
jgi:16S rRNA (cytosine1402-N4)-methyltransferase